MTTKRATRDPETHKLCCTLDQDEVALLKTRLSAAVDTLRRCADEKKVIAKQLADKVEAAKKAVCALNDETETGKGVRDVICTWKIEHAPEGGKRWYLRRGDTGEAISTEPLRADDLQEQMFS